MNIFNKGRGFTLIELLVVVTIISLLTSIVLVSLNSARTKGADSAIKTNLNNARPQAELYHANNTDSYGTSGYPNTGTGICSSAVLPAGTGIYQMLSAADAQSANVDCDSITTAWAAQAQLIASTNFYCVDSAGAAKIIASPGKGANATVCP